jgi:hypothetical protein
MLDAVLVTVAGVQLYVLSTRTADFFAWTIGVPLTAVFMGAGYWGSLISILWVLRTHDWQRVRIAMPAHVIFCLLSLLAALRFRSTLAADDWRTWAFIGVLLFSLATFSAAFWLQERGRRRLVPSERPLA